MDGWINREGILFIKRNDKFKKQMCYIKQKPHETIHPHDITKWITVYDDVPCSDSCPHFTEPVYKMNQPEGTGIFLQLNCIEKPLIFAVLDDDRNLGANIEKSNIKN